MNYKQCEEFLEVNRENSDLAPELFYQMRELLREKNAENFTDQAAEYSEEKTTEKAAEYSEEKAEATAKGKIAFCFRQSPADSLAMRYLERALKKAGIKVMVFAERTLGEYRDRWRTSEKSISQKGLCEIIERIKAIAEQQGGVGGVKDTAGNAKEGTRGECIPSKRQLEQLVAESLFLQSDATVLLCEKPLFDYLKIEGVTYYDVPRPKESNHKITKKSLKKQTADIGQYKNVTIGTLGSEAVVAACQVLELWPFMKEVGLILEEKHLRTAFEDTYITEGFGMVSAKPLMFVDGAVSAADVDRLTKDIQEYLSDKQKILIWGVTKQVRVEEVLPKLCTMASYILTVAPPRVDRIPSYDLAQEVFKVTPNVTAVDSLEEALEIVKLVLPKDGAVLTVGCQELLSRWMEVTAARS